MPNPNPSPKDRYKPVGDEPYAKQILGVRVRESLDKKIRDLPGDLSSRLRRWIEEGYAKDITEGRDIGTSENN